MLAPPGDLTTAMVADTLRDGWSVEVDLSYAAVGFGSHHWIGGDRFVSVDSIDDVDELAPALATAVALRDDAGLDFVVAPIPADDGRLLAPVGARWVVHVYERLEVVDDTRFGPHDDPEVVALVRRIHDATPLVAHHARREDFSLWDRVDLEEALDDLDAPWDTGPYGDRARALLAEHADDVRAALAAHDRLAASVPDEGWVVTHGEPHRGNVFRTTRGWAVVDWDTALVAPAERDLWDLAAAGGGGDPAVNELYRLRWDLMEIAVYVSGFYDDHAGDANDDQSWAGFERYIQVRQRWAHLL